MLSRKDQRKAKVKAARAIKMRAVADVRVARVLAGGAGVEGLPQSQRQEVRCVGLQLCAYDCLNGNRYAPCAAAFVLVIV